ncbi:YSC84-related protein [Temperatibacter marinus]|uniref:YSC84-related protein n=1 Tax=Temperatibacter marinus TaxID=1456591 RepID=A0AA52EB63_9PROT|nr:YSC84-related protein [Temperatibacter marinus]WND01606.1 YSC84-related protein [Temperatibacter marinus]
MIKLSLYVTLVFTLLMPHTFSASAQESGRTKSEKKRTKIMHMHDDVLVRLYREKRDAKTYVEDAYGYAVFSNLGVNLLLISAGGGKGVAIDNETGQKTFMKMGTAGVGLGVGVKDFRAVFAFHTREAFDAFVNKGWDFSGQADASARSGDKGGEISGAIDIGNSVTVYHMTEAGLSLQATLQGTKYWKDKKLNQ